MRDSINSRKFALVLLVIAALLNIGMFSLDVVVWPIITLAGFYFGANIAQKKLVGLRIAPEVEETVPQDDNINQGITG